MSELELSVPPEDDELIDDGEDDSADTAEEPGRATRRRRPPPAPGTSTVLEALDYAEPRPGAAARNKGTYGTYLSNALATVVANQLRPSFPGILPDPDGHGHESRARTAKGFKKLDVNYSTVELGLALGVSIKTINYRDPGTRRYTKNYSRVDNELRAEAIDYHQRQPYAVLAGLLFLPYDACDDAGVGPRQERGVSSFGAAVRYFRNRAPRGAVDDAVDLFERFFVGLYEHEGLSRGDAVFYDISDLSSVPPPRNRRPRPDEVVDLTEALNRIVATYDARNDPPFHWATD